MSEMQQSNSEKSLLLILDYMCLLLAFAIPLAITFTFATGDGAALAMKLQLATGYVSDAQRFSTCLVALIPALFISRAFLEVRKCLRMFRGGNYFSGAAVTALRRTAALIFFWALTSIPAASLMVLIASRMDGIPGSQISLVLGSNHFIALVMAGAIWAVAATIARAAAMAKDHAQII